jgi:adenosylcobinamide-GDP ribazoletransferase
MAKLLGALLFYTGIPLPSTWRVDVANAAQMAVVVGLLIGVLLWLLNWGLATLGMLDWIRSVVVVLVWVAITNGLHLDGAMDAADGLAVQEPQRRLQVMSDSHTGAFGAMAAIALLLLKSAALTDLAIPQGLALILAAGWGRWAQQVAIAGYPYLKPTGKGAFHKAALPSRWAALPSLAMLLGVSGLPLLQNLANWPLCLRFGLGGSAIACLVPAWFYRKFGGHTGDTYGAVVEWTEAFFLVSLTWL